MAGYTDRLSGEGAIRVIRRDAAGSYALAYDLPETYDVAGWSCDVDLVDIDFDGSLDVAFSFGGRDGTDDWLFKWDGTQLISITPTTAENGGLRSRLSSTRFVDITHSGWMQLAMPGFWGGLADNEPAPAPDELWEAIDGRYVRARFAMHVTTFRVRDVQTTFRYPTNIDHFRRSDDSTGPFRLRVVNGDRAGRHRVASGIIAVNDVVVIDAAQLTDRAEFVEVTLPAMPVESLLKVQLTGDPDAFILIIVSDSTVRNP